ncbi:MAG: CBS domain-containing protein, partial [Methanobacterium sp.]|nr:CBS domain-containing protein [Methanobacterium sp.]
TPVNKLVINGVVVGRDDMDNILLLDTTGIRSIPKKKVIEVASQDLITLDPNMNIKNAAHILSSKEIEGAPVMDNKEVIGVLTLSDITKALADDKENLKVKDIMSHRIITVEADMMIAEAVDVMNKNNIGRLIVIDENGETQGIITRTDLLNKIADLTHDQ